MNWSALSAFGGALALSPVALAQSKPPTKAECFDAHEQAQLANKEGKPRAAKRAFAICADAACPKLVKSECEAELAKSSAAVPSVVIVALDAGKAPTGAKLTIDGAPADAAPGPVELEPGEHLFRLQAADGRLAEQRVSLKAGQRDVEVRLELALPARAEPQAPTAPPPAKPGVSPVVWVLGGVAVIGLGGFVGFGLAGKSEESDLDGCKPDCSRGDVDSMRTSYLLADISLGVALVAGGVGGYLYLSGKKRPTEQSFYLRALPQRQGMGAGLGGRF